MSVPVLVLLAVLGLVGGIGITALGPGGVLPTVGLFALTSMTPAQVAGTAIITHVATGGLAMAAYTRSGQLKEPETRRTAIMLAGAAVIGTPIGVWINDWVSERTFGIVLAALLVLVAVLVWYREHRRQSATLAHPPVWQTVVLGFAVALVSAIVGVGGPMLTVPLLIVLGVPVLESLASAQAQSVVIATVGTVGYIFAGVINWPLAVLIGVPELIGVIWSWKIARALPTRALKQGMIVVLLMLAPYLILRG